MPTTQRTGCGRMMGANTDRASSVITKRFQFSIPAEQPDQTPRTFDISTLPNMRLQFPHQPPLPKPQKRPRPAADVDGEHSCVQKKKRRLRLFLITSRLSPQFSYPASNIVDRGSSKIAVWAKQKALGRNLLRKAAILNRIGRRAISAREAQEGRGRVLVQQEREQEELQLAKLEFYQSSVDTYTRPVLVQAPPGSAAVSTETGGQSGNSPSRSPSTSRSPSPIPSVPRQGEATSEYRSPNEAYAFSPPRAQGPRRDYLPLPPSPLGLSNYDAFDMDDDIPDPYSHLDDDDEHTSSSNFDDSPFAHLINPPTSSTIRVDTSQIPKTVPPLPTLYSDYDALDPEQAVFGDYDQVDDGADAIWPSSFVPEAVSSTIGSTSPDFPALFATERSTSSKRVDSFNTMPEFRPILSKISVSPNFPAATIPSQASSQHPLSSSSPNLPAQSPNFSPLGDDTPISPNFQPVFKSPNFVALDAPPPYAAKKKQSSSSSSCDAKNVDDDARTFVLAQKNSDMEMERQRQRQIMFMHFGS